MWKIWLHRIFRANKENQPYLPATSVYHLTTLNSYLAKYKTVYIKPDAGMQGRGVIKTWKTGNGYAYVREKGEPVPCASVKELHRRLKLAGKKTHLVQQGIDLAHVHGRPFDIRLMMMRDRKKLWTPVGMLAKVAGKHSVITNVARSRGYVLSIDQALKEGLGLIGEAAERKKREMIRLARRCTRIYSRYRYDWQIGYDIAIDRRGRIWLIEANPTVPAHGLFRRLSDPSIYRRIKRFASYHKGRPR